MNSVILEVLENAKFKSKTFRHPVLTKFNQPTNSQMASRLEKF